MLQFILWNANPEFLHSFGIDAGYDIRWYGLLFALGFLFGQIIISHIFKVEGKPEKDVEAITLVMVISTVVGARLGHCLGYEPEYYLAHPIEILQIWKGGLASHGATVGILLGLWFYSRSRKASGQSFLWIVDRIVIVVALGGSLIRMGNLMNSEIVGKPTDVPQAFMFVRPSQEVLTEVYGNYIDNISWEQTGKDTLVNGQILAELVLKYDVENGRLPQQTVEKLAKFDLPMTLAGSATSLEHIKVFPEKLSPVLTAAKGATLCSIHVFAIPRHPAQIYEALSTFLIFLFMYAYWNRHRDRTPQGSLFSIFVVVLFTLRILYEFLKENQVSSENGMLLNYGQLYSIPLVLAGFVLMYFVFFKKAK